MQNAKSITRGQFCGAVLVCAALLLSANALVGRLTEHTVSRRILLDTNKAGAAETIALGNSLVKSGFLGDEFSSAQPVGSRPSVLNMAMGASSPAEHLLLLRAALRSDDHARLLLYGFYDFQLTDPVSFAFSDLIGNHDLLYYDEPEFARRYYTMSRYDSAGFEIARRLPMLAERGAIWARVERLRRDISQQGMPRTATNQFGQVADFTLLEARSREDFEKHCERSLSAQLNAPVLELVHEAQERQLKVVFVLMPMPPKHVESFYGTQDWEKYQRRLGELLTKEDVTLLDASRWFPDAQRFGDALHLNEDGAKEFSRRLGASCGNVGQLDSCGK